jgi:hypothetical protein
MDRLASQKLVHRGLLKQTNLALGREDGWLPYIINTLTGFKKTAFRIR